MKKQLLSLLVLLSAPTFAAQTQFNTQALQACSFIENDFNRLLCYDNTVAGNETISNDSRARYKPSYRNFHVKVSNNSFIQAVSIFAIGFSEHFVTENGGDISLTNSNSNFGANALTSVGSGSSNTAVGNNALFSLSTAISNTAVGNDALLFNQTANYNS